MGDATGVWCVNALSCARRRGLTRKDQDETRLCDVILSVIKLQQAHLCNEDMVVGSMFII